MHAQQTHRQPIGRRPEPRDPERRGTDRTGVLCGAILVLLHAGSVVAQAVAAQPVTGTVPTADRAVRAFAIDQPITIDGDLIEPVWAQAPMADGFLQVEPEAGQPSSQATTVRVAYDAKHLYFGVRCLDTQGSRGARVSDLRRDFDHRQSDSFSVILDPFGDGRTAQVFSVNPAGAQRDLRVSDGLREDLDWNTLWHSAAHSVPEGWTAEIAIPWSSLRYRDEPGAWRVNFVRRVRRNEELSAWVGYPRNLPPYDTTYSGKLEGLKTPARSLDLQFSPYALSRARRELGSASKTDFDFGGELKWLPGPATVVDLTVNTDFAQAEVDRQVINLSRFSVLFPEKRQFFLESSALFDSGRFSLKPFYSRRIGLDELGQPVSISGGVRAVHQDRKRSIGGLLMRTREQGAVPASTFVVGRYGRNVGARSSFGGTIIHRADRGGELAATRDNTVWQFDGIWKPSDSFTLEALGSTSHTSGPGGEGIATSLSAFFENPRVELGWAQEVVSDDYRADSGFVSGHNLITTSPELSFDLRPGWLPARIRSFKPNTFATIYHDYDDGQFREGTWTIEPLWFVFQNGAEIWSWFDLNRQRLESPFSPLPGLEVAPGDYRYDRWGIAARSDRSRRLSAEARWLGGGFFDGKLDRWLLRSRYAPSPRMAIAVSYDRRELREIGDNDASRSSELLVPELRLALNSRLQATIFYQHNTAAGLDNLYGRLVWEWRPLSFIHLVYSRNDPLESTMDFGSSPDQSSEQLILKFTWTGRI